MSARARAKWRFSLSRRPSGGLRPPAPAALPPRPRRGLAAPSRGRIGECARVDALGLATLGVAEAFVWGGGEEELRLREDAARAAVGTRSEKADQPHARI